MKFSPIYKVAPQEARSPLEDKVYETLEHLKIPYERIDHEAVSSMDECIEVNEVLGVEIRKNIFLCNAKKTSFFLLVLPANKPFDTKKFSQKLGLSHISFAPEEYMEKYLGTKTGSATIMGLLCDKDDYIQVVLDKEITEEEYFGCNPGQNTSHIKIKTEDLLKKFLPYVKHRPKIIDL